MPSITSFSSNGGGTYGYRSSSYTGTKKNPDNLIFFVKDDNAAQKLKCHLFENDANFFGKVPIIGYLFGAKRVADASSNIFKHLKDKQPVEKKVYWMDLKNFGRGLLEILPGTGLLHLFYDSIRSAAHCSSVRKQVANQNNIAGISLDGKVICTIDLKTLDNLINQRWNVQNTSSEDKLGILKDYCNSYMQISDPKQVNLHEVLTDIITKIDRNYST